MKDLTQIIERLQQINIKVIEKDNIINWYTDVLNLFTQLMSDPSFKQSEIYLDLRAKYLGKIEEKLQKINDAKITIEPEAVLQHITANNINNTVSAETKAKKKQFTLSSEKVIAPLKTDIFLAPGSRYKFSKKKIAKSDDTSGELECQYIQFTHNQKDYFIENVPNDAKSTVLTYDIVDKNYQIMGQLKGTQIILLHQNDLSLSETIELKSVSVDAANKLPKNKHVLGNYVMTE